MFYRRGLLGSGAAALLGSYTTLTGAFVPGPSSIAVRGPQRSVPVARWFRVPEPIPFIETLESNATKIFGLTPSDDKDDFSMPCLLLDESRKRNAMNTTEAAASPALFVSKLGSWNESDRPVWLRPINTSFLEPPEPGKRVMVYRNSTALERLSCGLRRRLSPFPLFTKSVPFGSVLVGSITGEDLTLASESGQGLAKLFAEPTVGWLEPVSPLVKAAHDPRVSAIILRMGRLTCGYGKLVELRRHMEYFKSSGKTLVCYLDSGAEKEYYAALGCDEIYMPPGGSLRLQGFVASASFLRGVLDKVGLEPTVVRIGKYKSAGDTINRANSTEAFREVQSLLLQQTAEHWVAQVAADLNKTEEEVRALWDTPMTEPVKLAHNRFITASLYFDQVKQLVCERFPTRKFPWSFKKRPAKAFGMRNFLRAVGSGKRILPGLPGVYGPRIAVLNAVGSIAANGAISAVELNEILKDVEEDPGVKAVVLRIDSPGGDALTSELIWRRILKLRAKKPVVASMVDVAASGGYFLAMGCNAIVAEETTITGSIGVVAILFKLKTLFERIGLNEESISIGKYAKFFVPSHSLNDDEREMFEKDVYSSYQDFVGKAAFCRNFTWDQANEVAQGRVWRGTDALERGLVDTHGGVWRAVEVAKKLAKIDDKRGVNMMVVKGPRRLFNRGSVEGDESVYAPVSGLSEPAAPMAVADEIVEIYFRAIAASLPTGGPGVDLRLGLGGSLALLQSLGRPVAEKLLLMLRMASLE